MTRQFKKRITESLELVCSDIENQKGTILLLVMP